MSSGKHGTLFRIARMAIILSTVAVILHIIAKP